MPGAHCLESCAGPPHTCRRGSRRTSIAASAAGLTVVELLMVMLVAATIGAVAIPGMLNAVDRLRTAMAARYLAARLQFARLDAVRRSSSIGLRFVPAGADYTFASFMDGNGNGVRSTDIAAGLDPALTAFELLGDKFRDVSLALMPGVPDADGNVSTSTDGVQIGSARILTMSGDGTSTSGTLYVRGRRHQFAVRVLGATGRLRVLEYQPIRRAWIAR